MNLALFGGTFDPIHLAHLEIARQAATRFALDRVLFIPAGNPPWKEMHASYADRLRMVELACAHEPRFQASRLEEGTETSYSIDTVERARVANPAAHLFFIIGTDAFEEIGEWHRSADLLRAVEFIVVTRPEHRMKPVQSARVRLLDTVALDVSSSEIRRQIAHGEPPRDLPPEVAAYVHAHHLYNAG